MCYGKGGTSTINKSGGIPQAINTNRVVQANVLLYLVSGMFAHQNWHIVHSLFYRVTRVPYLPCILMAMLHVITRKMQLKGPTFYKHRRIGSIMTHRLQQPHV